MLCESIEIPVVVEKDQVTLNASGSNKRVYGLPHRDSQSSERAEISGSLNSNFESADFKLLEMGEKLPCGVEVAFTCEALQHLGQHQVAYGQRFIGKKGIEAIGLWCRLTP